MAHAPKRSLLPRIITGLAAAAMLAIVTASTSHAAAAAKPFTAKHVRTLVDAARKQLAIPQKVGVEIVEVNKLKASVEPVKDPKAKVPFRMSIERAFLAELSEDELKAVVAHELGHVWIYTHHPYLQTEQLANTIALRVTSRDALVKVYGKVWADESVAGNLPRLPEPQTAAGLSKPNRDNVK